MSYWGRGILGIVLAAAGIAASASALYGLLLTGTCASGGPYVIANPCPEGTGLRIALLTLGILAALIGLGVAGTRRYDGERAPLGLAGWCVGFGALAVTFLAAGFGPDAPDGDTGWKVFNGLMGGFFALFVIPPLFFGRAGRERRRTPPAPRDGLGDQERAELAELDELARSAEPAGDLASQLQELGDLRTRGLLTDEEFQKAKDRLLGGS